MNSRYLRTLIVANTMHDRVGHVLQHKLIIWLYRVIKFSYKPGDLRR